MKPMKLFAAGAVFLAGVAFGAVATHSQTTSAQQVQAEAPLPVPPKPLEVGEVGRYQISAFAASNNIWGCYRIDTQTGDTWISSNGGKFRRINNN